MIILIYYFDFERTKNYPIYLLSKFYTKLSCDWFSHFFSFSTFIVLKHSPINFRLFQINNSSPSFKLFAARRAVWQVRELGERKLYRTKINRKLSSRLNLKHEVEHANVRGKSNFRYPTHEKLTAARFTNRCNEVESTTWLQTVQVKLSQRKLQVFYPRSHVIIKLKIHHCKAFFVISNKLSMFMQSKHFMLCQGKLSLCATILA